MMLLTICTCAFIPVKTYKIHQMKCARMIIKIGLVPKSHVRVRGRLTTWFPIVAGAGYSHP